MRIPIQGVSTLALSLLVGLLPAGAMGQGAAGGGPPGLDRTPRAAHSQEDRDARWNESKGRAFRGRAPRSNSRARHARNLHIPKGHRPPPGHCRLWYPGRPPGHQPPPMTCRVAVRKQRGPAVVITHTGTIYRPRPPRWHRRPTGDIVYRRRPHREEGVFISVEILIDILGRSGVRHLQAERRRLGLHGALNARWISTDRTNDRVLRVRAGNRPMATLVDRNGDGRIEALYVRQD